MPRRPDGARACLFVLLAAAAAPGAEPKAPPPAAPPPAKAPAPAAPAAKGPAAAGAAIPVGRDDRRYPLYAAQQAFQAGKLYNAWALYLGSKTVLPSMFKELDPAFCAWLIDKSVEAEDLDNAEAIARALIQWLDTVTDRFSPQTRARVLVAYAGISLARQEYPKARALFERVATAKEFEGTPAQFEAELKVAEVDRLTRRFDEAIKRLEKLAAAKDRALQAEAHYHLALVKYDQEEYREALEQIDQVLARAADHALARILEGRIKVKMRKLEEPTEIQVGTATARRYIVPGKTLKVNLEDRNLAIVGSSTHIQIRAWTDSGDEELFTLAPFGDSKTRFVGQIPTEMAPVAKGDGKMQLLGSDTLRYDYAEAFKREHKIAGGEPQALAVATDADLLVSSGKIITREEREARALEEAIRRKLRLDARGRPMPPEGKAEGEDEAEDVALSTIRAENQIKPGNPFNVRVIDPDRNTSAGKDKVTVRVTTTSGDSIPAFSLEETGTHTGVFEGAVPTSAGHPTAFASGSADGSDPNFAISPRLVPGQPPASYPPWVAVGDLVMPKFYSIDLNDNVALGKMTILANVPGRKLKRLLVQTSLNGTDFVTVAQWPGAQRPWDGSLTLELAKHGPVTAALPAKLGDFTDYLETGYLKARVAKLTVPAKRFAGRWDASVEGQAHALGLADDGPGSAYVAHLYGAFYQPERKVRTFTIEDPEARGEATEAPPPKGAEAAARKPAASPRSASGVTYILAVDGVPGDSPTRVRRSLGKGVHRVDLYIAATRKTPPSFELLCEAEEPPFLKPVPPEMFDAAKNPAIAQAVGREPAKVLAAHDNSSFDITFPPQSNARVVRLVLADFEGDAPAISRITLTDAAGATILPTKEDFALLRKNHALEIVPGDRITVTYEDPRVITEGRETHEASLTATFSNAAVSACFVEYSGGDGADRRARYIPMRRFKPGDKINVYINDPDCDVTGKPDTVKFTAKTTEGKPVEFPALETAEHSGIFVGGIFPVAGEPKRQSELKVAPGDDVLITYLDKENTAPGIPWERTCTVEQTVFTTPQLRIYEVTSEALGAEEAKKEAEARRPSAAPGQAPSAAQGPQTQEEEVLATRTLTATWPPKPQLGRPAPVFIGGPVIVELTFPFIAQSPESTATLYLQTESGRKAMGKAPGGAFDVTVPGTVRIEARPGNAPGGLTPPPGYRGVAVKGNPVAGDPLEDGRFTFAIATELGKLPDKSLVGDETSTQRPTLAVKGNDEVHIGFEFKDPAGQTSWVTARAVLKADGFFDIMDQRYRETVEGAYVGESLYFRVIDPARDTSDEKDTAPIALKTASGTTQRLDLVETFTHSGVFKGAVRAGFKGETAAAKDAAKKGEGEADQPAMASLPVAYGDKVVATYVRPDGLTSIERSVTIHKGSDGDVVPFTKRFSDPQIAVRTQFSIAEAYFELAKRHRELGEDDLARTEIAQGKKLLEEAIRDFPDAEARAQADYLLADLTVELADENKDEAAKKKLYMEAVNAFTDIVARYPESPYAPKAQYKKALVYEKMGLIDQACEEHVKLSYRFPDNELVAETIARLGQYFLSKGKEIRAKATPETPPVEREKLEMQAREMLKTAAQVFGRLAVRFPGHRLAGRTLVLSAQCYMQAEELPKAVEVFKAVVQNPKMDSDLVAEAMYWCGDTYMKQRDPVNAYRMFKKLTWDYPASKWAKFARGRLTEDALVRAGDAETTTKAPKKK